MHDAMNAFHMTASVRTSADAGTTYRTYRSHRCADGVSKSLHIATSTHHSA